MHCPEMGHIHHPWRAAHLVVALAVISPRTGEEERTGYRRCDDAGDEPDDEEGSHHAALASAITWDISKPHGSSITGPVMRAWAGT